MIIASIDPGPTTCGVAFYTICDNTFQVLDLISYTVEVNSTVYLENRINIIYNRIKELMYIHRPFQLVHETSFLDRFRPMAVIPLSISIYLLRSIFKDMYGLGDHRGIFGYPPKSIKASMIKGDANKHDMFDAVTTIPELKSFITGLESEHEIDAIAIGYTHIKNFREQPELLLI